MHNRCLSSGLVPAVTTCCFELASSLSRARKKPPPAAGPSAITQRQRHAMGIHLWQSPRISMRSRTQSSKFVWRQFLIMSLAAALQPKRFAMSARCRSVIDRTAQQISLSHRGGAPPPRAQLQRSVLRPRPRVAESQLRRPTRGHACIARVAPGYIQLGSGTEFGKQLLFL